jgi:diacylglycerol kinase family enzyme
VPPSRKSSAKKTARPRTNGPAKPAAKPIAKPIAKAPAAKPGARKARGASRPKLENVLVVLNARAGALLGRDGAEVVREVEEALAAGEGKKRRVTVKLVKGKAIVRAIEKGAAGEYDTLIVGGGDGSVNCAITCLYGTGKTLGVLPLGTMNLFARDLEVPAEIGPALRALAEGRVKTIDIGTLNGRYFHTLSGIGFFSQMARAREEVRGLPGRVIQVGMAAFRALTRTGRFSVSLTIDGKRLKAETYALLVTVNRFSGDQWKRETLSGGTLEVHVATEESALSRLKAGADLLTGSWRENPGIESHTAQRVRIRSARKRVWVATDGERVREGIPLEYRIVPDALNVIFPRPAAD